MKILLRSTKTGRYFQTHEDWTDDAGQATEFDKIEEVIKTACIARLEQVEAVVRTDDCGAEITLPFR